MAITSILLANEPRAYRDTIAVALRLLRPETNVIVADPDRLDEFILQHAPQIVISSQLTSLVETQVPVWAVLYPDGATGALLSIRGDRTTVKGIDLRRITDLIDQTGSLYPAQT